MNDLKQPQRQASFFSSARLAIFGILFSSLVVSSVLYAAGIFPSLSTPAGQTSNGSFSTRLTNMSHTCPADNFIKGFDADYNAICVPYTLPNTSAPAASTGSFAVPPAGEMPGGKFGTYFNNIANTCSGNGILKGFTAQGKKICVSATDRVTLTDSPTDSSFGASSIPSPAAPGGETTGGSFQSYFNKLLGAPCGAQQGVTGIGSDGTPTCAAIPVPTCVVTSCSAGAPACDTTTYGTDNCGGSCSKNGVACGAGAGGGGGGGVTCPAGAINGVLSPDQSPGIANSCNFTWQSGTWSETFGGSSLVATGDHGGTANGTCNKYGNWDYFFNCPNLAPGAVNCVGGGYSISSSDGSNVCQFYWPNLLAGQSAAVNSVSGSPGGSANGSCNAVGQWTYNYSCPNLALPSCSGGGAQWGACSFNWGPASAGGNAFAFGYPYGTISASCDANGNWVNINVNCP